MKPETSLATHLTELRQRAGMSLQKVAEEAGYAGRSSVQRFFENHDIISIAPAIARKLAHALYGKGNPPIGLTDLAPIIGMKVGDPYAVSLDTISHLLDLPLNPEIDDELDISRRPFEAFPVVGSAHASSWKESAPSLDAPEDWILMLTRAMSGNPIEYALRIMGPSVNKVADEGSYAICQRYGDGLTPEIDGKFVHVERSRDGFTEWTIKKVRWHNGRQCLFPYSNHPDHQLPIDFGKTDDEVRILGLVAGWFTPA